MLRQPVIIAAVIVAVGLLASAAAICSSLHAIGSHLQHVDVTLDGVQTVRVNNTVEVVPQSGVLTVRQDR